VQSMAPAGRSCLMIFIVTPVVILKVEEKEAEKNRRFDGRERRAQILKHDDKK
jgi:hypothetical protein